METSSSLKPVLEWACRDSTISTRYQRILDVEGVQSIEDLSELTLEDMREMGIKDTHAKKLTRKCKKMKIKIAVGSAENVVGIIQVPRGMKLCDVRRVIARDRLPQVPSPFQFRMDDMAIITQAQEGTWDADVFIDDSGNSVCILVPQKTNKGSSDSSTVNGSVGHAATNSSSSGHRTHSKESTHRAAMQQNRMQHQAFPHPTSQQPAVETPPQLTSTSLPHFNRSYPVFTEPLPAPSSTLPPFHDLQALISVSSASHLSTKDLVNSSLTRAVSHPPGLGSQVQQSRSGDVRSEAQPGLGVSGGGGGRVEAIKRPDRKSGSSEQWNSSTSSTRPPRHSKSNTQVYIGGLVWNSGSHTHQLKDIDLVNSFIYKFGHVKEYTRQAPNYAFIAFTYPESAKTCIQEMNGRHYHQFKFICRYATKHFDYSDVVPKVGSKIHLLGVTESVESKAVMRTFKRFGMVVNIVLQPSRHMGLVMFEERRAAETAVGEMGSRILIRNVLVELSLEEEEESDESEFSSDGEDEFDDMMTAKERLPALIGQSGEATYTNSDTSTMMYTAIASYLSGVSGDFVKAKLKSLVKKEKDMKLLCSLLLPNGLQKPQEVASLCKELVDAELQLQDVGMSYGSVTKMLLAECQEKLIEILESGTVARANELKGLMAFLAHLYNEQVITSSVVFGCANRVLDSSTAAYVVSVQHLLGAAERQLQREDNVKTDHLKRRVMNAKQQRSDTSAANSNGKIATLSSINTAPHQRELDRQKRLQQLGNELYQKVYQKRPQIAGKITGMLLDGLGEDLVRHLLLSEVDLTRKVAEAEDVIRQHSSNR